jgi:hypothetical protein
MGHAGYDHQQSAIENLFCSSFYLPEETHQRMLGDCAPEVAAANLPKTNP